MNDHTHLAPTQVHGGTVVLESGPREADILISSTGRIDAVTEHVQPLPSHKQIDARGLLVFPGVIDAHAHLDDPPGGPGEDFLTGTHAAAAGGVTTVLDMPQGAPTVTSLDELEEKQRIVGPKAVVDYGLWAGMTPENVSGQRNGTLAALVSAGVVGFKAFTLDSPELPAMSDEHLLMGLKRTAELGALVGVHCEDQTVIDKQRLRLTAAGRDDPLVTADRRPLEAELEAVRFVLRVAQEAQARVHIAHASHPAVIEAVVEARGTGLKITAETCAHYLTLSRDVILSAGPYAVCNPPLRDLGAVEGLWAKLFSGSVDIIASDHCSYSDQEKAWGDDWSTAPGIHGIQIMFPLVVGEALARGLPLHRVAAVFSTNVARVFGLYPGKGSLLPGGDADLTFIDPSAHWTVRPEALRSKANGTAYNGHQVKSAVRRTMVRGVVVFEHGLHDAGQILVKPGYGRFARPVTCS